MNARNRTNILNKYSSIVYLSICYNFFFSRNGESYLKSYRDILSFARVSVAKSASNEVV